ncbi:MAG: ABC transporter ATP-binding protein [Alphaproteobacteria bacterium]|nr:ABC transporter ATP-binding protein [Alphaproteobacteria bacterium]
MTDPSPLPVAAPTASASNWMRVIRRTLAERPADSALMVALLAVSGAMEALGLAILLPVLYLLLGEEGGTAQEIITATLGWIGLKPTLESLILLLIAIAVAKAGIVFIAQKKVGDAVVGIGRALRRELITALSKARWPFFVSQSSGELSNALTFEAENASNTYFHTARLLAGFLIAGFYVITVAALSPFASLAAAIIAPGLIYVMRSLVHMAERSGRDQTRLLKSGSRVLIDLLAGFKVLKASAQEPVMVASLASINDDLAAAKRREVFAKEGMIAAQEAIVIILIAVGLYVFNVFFEGRNSELLLVCLAFMRIMGRVSTMQGALQSILRCNAAYESLMQSIRKATSAAETPGGTATPTLDRAIEVKNVSFRHDTTVVFDSFSVTIPAGSFTLLAGPSGTGKTTFLDLLIGLQTPDEGDILLDGAPLESVDRNAWRHMIAYVPQEPVLLHDSIRNNLTLYQEGVADEDLWEALALVKLATHIRSLPKALDASVGERGLALSGGQRQRLMIARALLRKPKLLILDEATSGLDPATEKQILEIITPLEMTKIAISHQTSLRPYADNVIELLSMPDPTTKSV